MIRKITDLSIDRRATASRRDAHFPPSRWTKHQIRCRSPHCHYMRASSLGGDKLPRKLDHKHLLLFFSRSICSSVIPWVQMVQIFFPSYSIVCEVNEKLNRWLWEEVWEDKVYTSILNSKCSPFRPNTSECVLVIN